MNPGGNCMTLVASGNWRADPGDCIDDADVLRTGGTAPTLGCVVKAPRHRLGTVPGDAASGWGHVLRSGQPGAAGPRAWSAGAVTRCDAPFTMCDLDSTIGRDIPVWPRRGR